jgi:hypothetical protein
MQPFGPGNPQASPNVDDTGAQVTVTDRSASQPTKFHHIRISLP